MQAYYERDLKDPDTTWAGFEDVAARTLFLGSPLVKLVYTQLPPEQVAGLVVDAGCGPGLWVWVLRQWGYRVEGIETSVVAIQKAQKVGLPVIYGSVTYLPYPSKSVSVYLSLGVVEHLQMGPHVAFREACRVLQDDGVALFSVPYRNGLRWLCTPIIALYQRRQRLSGAPFHQYVFSEAELTRMLAVQGLRVLESWPYGPTKMFRKFLTRAQRGRVDAIVAAGRMPRWKRWLLRLFYTSTMLRLCGHMLLVRAVPSGR